MCGGGGKTPKPPVYTSSDGRTYEDPNKAAERDRTLRLATAYGYDKNAFGGASAPVAAPAATASAPATAAGARGQQVAAPVKATAAATQAPAASAAPGPLTQWMQTVSPEMAKAFMADNDMGLTAADKRANDRIKEQEDKAKEAEDTRKAAVESGRSAVSSAFGGFGDKYYDDIASTVLDYYLPQVEQQYNDASDQLIYKFARQGQTASNSKTVLDEQGNLKGKYDIQKAQVINQAKDASRQARENISGAKSTLLSYADTAADAGAVDDRLATETGRIKNYAPELTPIGQLFPDYVSPIVNSVGTGLLAEANGYGGFNTGVFDKPKNKSTNVVR